MIATVDRLVAAYNARDADAFAACFTDDGVIVEYPGRALDTGREAIRATYRDLFARYPFGSTTVLARIFAGGRVLDHELVDRGEGAPPFAVLTIYTLDADAISRAEFLSSGRAHT